MIRAIYLLGKNEKLQFWKLENEEEERIDINIVDSIHTHYEYISFSIVNRTENMKKKFFAFSFSYSYFAHFSFLENENEMKKTGEIRKKESSMITVIIFISFSLTGWLAGLFISKLKTFLRLLLFSYSRMMFKDDDDEKWWKKQQLFFSHFFCFK